MDKITKNKENNTHIIELLVKDNYNQFWNQNNSIQRTFITTYKNDVISCVFEKYQMVTSNIYINLNSISAN